MWLRVLLISFSLSSACWAAAASLSTGAYTFENYSNFSVTISANEPVLTPDFFVINYSVTYGGYAYMWGGVSLVEWKNSDGTIGRHNIPGEEGGVIGSVNILNTCTHWRLVVYGDYYGNPLEGTYKVTDWFPLTLEKGILFNIVNDDQKIWSIDWVSGGQSTRGAAAAPGAGASMVVTENNFINGKGYLRFSASPTWEELHPKEAFDVAQSIRDQVLAVIRDGAEYTEGQCEYPYLPVFVHIPAGSYKSLRNGGVITNSPTVGGLPTVVGHGSVDSTGSTGQNTAVDEAKAGASDGAGGVRLPTVLTPIADPKAGVDGVTGDGTAVVKALTDIHDRETVLWEQKEAADQRRADTFNKMLFGSGTGNAGWGAGSDPAGTYLGQAAGIGNGTGGSGYSVPQYDGLSAGFGKVPEAVPSAPAGLLGTVTVGGRAIAFNLDNWGAAEPARAILLAGRPVLVWALAVVFLVWCGHELQSYLVGLTLAPQADSNVGLENVGPGVAQAKTWGSAALIVAAICAAFAAAVALVNTWVTDSGGVGLTGIFSGSLGALGGGIGLLDKYFPVLAVLQYTALRAAFHFAVGPMYLATASAIKFMKA